MSVCLVVSSNKVSVIKYSTPLVPLNWQSEERKRDLLNEIMLEEQRGREISLNLKELLTENRSEANEKTSRMRKVSIPFAPIILFVH